MSESSQTDNRTLMAADLHDRTSCGEKAIPLRRAFKRGGEASL